MEAGVRLQSPEAFAVTVPTTAPSTVTFTVLPASAVPEMAGLPELPAAAGAVSTGATGATVSTVKLRGVEEAPVLPAASVAVAVAVCAP